MRKTLIGVFSLLSCCIANADTILTVEYLDEKEQKEQLEKLSKIVFDINGNMTFSYNSGESRDFGNVSNTQKIIFSEGLLTKVDNQSSVSPIQVFPNPTTETVTVLGKKDGEIAKIYSITGNLVLSSQDSEIDVSQLVDGQYLMVIGNTILKLIKK